MTHSDLQARMASYLDGELSLGARALFDAHLDQCEACSLELSQMRDTIRLLRTLPSPEPPADLVSSVMRRIAQGEAQPSWFDRVIDGLSLVLLPRIAIPATAVAAALTLTVMSGDLNLRSLDLWQTPSQLGFAGMTLEVHAGDERSAKMPVAAGRVARVERSSRVPAPTPVRLATPTPRLHYHNGSGAGSFLFRVANDQLGPIRRQPREGDVASRILLMSGSPRPGPFLGASAAPSIVLGASQYIAGAGSVSGTAGSSLARGLVPVAVSRVSPGPDGLGFTGHAGEVSPLLRRQQELDGRLNFLMRDPPGFARQQARRSLAEQEHWLRQLAARAEEIGDVERVTSALEGSGDEEAVNLARSFEMAVKRNHESWAAAQVPPNAK